MTDYVGVVEFRDIGAGEFFLNTIDDLGSRYKLVITNNFQIYNYLKDCAGAGQIVVVKGSSPSDDIYTAGGSDEPVVIVQAVE